MEQENKYYKNYMQHLKNKNNAMFTVIIFTNASI